MQKHDHCPNYSPWGPVQHGECLALGIWSISTAGHGGIWISPQRRASMPAPYSDFSSLYGDIPNGFYEEDCDWVVAVLAFASELKPHFVELAQEYVKADKDSGRNYFAALHAKRIVVSDAVEFNEADCSGAFDGRQVTSDADPGL